MGGLGGMGMGGMGMGMPGMGMGGLGMSGLGGMGLGSMGMGGMGMGMGGMGSGGGNASQAETQSANDVVVEVYGIVYIYNPVNKKALKVDDAATPPLTADAGTAKTPS